MSGQITTRAAVNGRPITLDPLMEREPMPLPVRRVENTLPCGLRQSWITGDSAGDDSPVKAFSLTAGAGVGSPYLILQVHMRDGSTISEIVDMRDVVPKWIAAAVAAGSTPAVP